MASARLELFEEAYRETIVRGQKPDSSLRMPMRACWLPFSSQISMAAGSGPRHIAVMHEGRLSHDNEGLA